MSAQGTRKLETTDRIDHKVREKKVIQLGGPQPESSNNPLFSGWACKPYLYIELTLFYRRRIYKFGALTPKFVWNLVVKYDLVWNLLAQDAPPCGAVQKICRVPVQSDTVGV